jgi:DNA polymerase III delta prime subunit
MRFLKGLQLFKRYELFDHISGYDEIKWTLQRALQSEEPIHILFVGPPGLGKTRFLKAIEKEYPDLSYWP